MAEQKPQNHSPVGDRKLTDEEVFDFFRSLAQCVLDHGGMSVADLEAIALDHRDVYSDEIVYGWWKNALVEPRFQYDTVHIPLRQARARGDVFMDDED